MIQWLPSVLSFSTGAVNVLSKGVQSVTAVATASNVLFTQNYRQKELTTRLVQMYTTDSKNVKGSLLPESNFNKEERSEQIQELIHSLLNQTRANNI